ncbi:MAG: FAD-dependent oxidoreductase [Chloroflexi bacterium]|nr:FAD-dependent oxidoreductase [Chloroflexota bacterium]
MAKGVLVVGGDVAGIQAALDLAQSGSKVYLVERSLSLTQEDAPEDGGCATPAALYWPRVLAAISHPNIQTLTNSYVEWLQGQAGDFCAGVVTYPRFVEEDRCTGCGRCERECPVSTDWTANSFVSGKAIGALSRRDVPLTYAISKPGLAPCRLACPAGINVQGYVALISQGKFAQALDLIRQAIPLPGVCGRVCNRPCEAVCNRKDVDDAVAICSLKRFVSDYEPTAITDSFSSAPSRSLPKPPHAAKVAVVGSGPAGLAAARDLARLGHSVTVLEALPFSGGMLRACIPRFRLPPEVVEAEVDYVKSFGVEIRTSTPIGKNLTIDDLKAQGYRAIFLAVGTHQPRKMNLAGGSLPGVIDCVDLLKRLSLGEEVAVGRRAMVVGGGNAAIDAARTLLRLGAQSVAILYRRTEKEMSAHKAEVAEAEVEGVTIQYLVGVRRVLGDGSVAGVECVRMELGEVDEGGRAVAHPVAGSEFILEADTVVLAVGQQPDLSFLPMELAPQLANQAGNIAVDDITMATGIPGVFAGGDAVTGPSTVVEAIAAGQRAALSIDIFLKGQARAWVGPVGRPHAVVLDPARLRPVPAQRQEMPSLPPARRKTFDEVELGFDAAAVVAEAKRCLNCGTCSECLECEKVCEMKAIAHRQRPRELEVEVAAVVVAGSANSLHVAGSLPPDTHSAARLGRVLGLAVGEDGSYVRRDNPAISSRDGIYLAVGQNRLASPEPLLGSAAAAEAMAAIAFLESLGGEPDVFSHRKAAHGGAERSPFDAAGREARLARMFGSEVRGLDAAPGLNGGRRIGVFICRCGGQISSVVDTAALAGYAGSRDNVVYTAEVSYACSKPWGDEMLRSIDERKLDRVVVAACACCSSRQICFACSHHRLRCKGSLLDGVVPGRCEFEFVNIREHCAWVHYAEVDRASAKARTIVGLAVARARGLRPVPRRPLPIRPAALVLGAGVSGRKGASTLAVLGFETVLLGVESSLSAVTSLLEVEGLTLHVGDELVGIRGSVGDFRVLVGERGVTREYAVGAIVVDGVAVHPEQTDVLGRQLGFPAGAKWMAGVPMLGYYSPETSLPGVYFCEASSSPEEALVVGAAAAGKAAAFLAAGTLEPASGLVAVDELRCRGCADCVAACPFYAIRLDNRATGVKLARVDQSLCRGCGLCIPSCTPRAIVAADGSTEMEDELLAALLA